MRKPAFCVFIILLCLQGHAQICIERGQTPSTAFPVCGTSVFKQTTVPLCAGRTLPSPSCKPDVLADVNPYWYKFTCFQAGTLGFTITPDNLSDDYDWELYDITGRNPNDIYTDGKLVVSSNWSGEGGKTGAGTSGRSVFVCAGFGKDLYSSMVTLQKGNDYLLLISHFTQSQSGYDLEFKGGTAVITDTLTPHLKTAEAACIGNIVRVQLNKRIKCETVALDGTDFYFSVAGINAVATKAIGCANGFDTDSLEITLSASLNPGTYQVFSKKGSDGNTVLDICDNPMPANDFAGFTVYPIAPTPMDSMVPVACSPNIIKLIFRKPITCSSIAADGSDFKINGTYAVAISGATGVCNVSGASKEIIITLQKPLQQKGSFSLVLQQGNDGNTLLDECAQQTRAGTSLAFALKDTVNADFTYSLQYGCSIDTVNYFHNGSNEVNSWKWNLDEEKGSNSQNPQARYSIFNEKSVSLIVSNGFCRDTSQQKILLDNFLKADFEAVLDNCPLETIPFTSTAIGKIKNHNWTFGDGDISTDKSPEHIYAQPLFETSHQVRYSVNDSFGCEKSITKVIKIYSSCTVFIPNAFTPNNDGMNDVFSVLNAVKAEKFHLMVYNRWGQLAFQTNDWKKGWDGKIRGALQGAGTFVWFVKYVDTRTNQPVERKGTVVLIR